MDRLTKEQFHQQACQLRDALAQAVLKVQDIPGLAESSTGVIIDAALARASFYAPVAANVRARNDVDTALEQFSAELISLMLTYAAGELPEGFDKLPRPF